MQAFRTTALLALAMAIAAPVASAQQPADTSADAPRQIVVTILGMSCPFCAYGVEKKLKRLDGVEELEVVLETGLATLVLKEGADLSNDVLRESIKDAGFEAAKIVRNFDSEFPDFGMESMR